jgi:hypothetical protein
MKPIDREKIREDIARRKARGNVANKDGRVITAAHKKELDKRASHTPYLDKLFAMSD